MCVCNIEGTRKGPLIDWLSFFMVMMVGDGSEELMEVGYERYREGGGGRGSFGGLGFETGWGDPNG